ncbi:tyrosine-type recombinase/integrase [Lysinibacillus xylanilyticus]|uniref:Tyrosine-type recombinase/integrase n=1 Tax=Lysinibacillus xylanilyticus TaxID=582475 RepID=A0ABT4EWU6_9BACI|nr:tyrosine-type recombinase/integrase [Lysinibacillus xylanilyticus]MCY9550028.1 tyrosine-type recombinase/integrase [Lysinibacillus xylanilyticus]
MLLKFAYDDFIADRKFNNTTQANINSYKYMIKPFIEYCIEEGAINVEDVTHNHLKNYLVMCQQQNKKPNTINTIILRAKAFFNYLVDEGIIQDNIAKKIKVQKVDIKIDTFTDNQINQMVAFYRVQRKRHQSYSSYRNLLIVLVLLGAGIRRKELIMLKWDDVDFKNQTLQVHGKSRKYETVFLTDKLTKELLAFRAFSRSSFKTECEYVFITNKNEPFTINTIDYVFRELKQKMNFKDVRVSPHTFRHTFCRNLVQSNVNSFTIMKLMRHENIVTTQRYVNLWGSHLKQENDKHNPLNNFDF